MLEVGNHRSLVGKALRQAALCFTVEAKPCGLGHQVVACGSLRAGRRTQPGNGPQHSVLYGVVRLTRLVYGRCPWPDARRLGTTGYGP